MSYILGLDTSQWQGTGIDWNQVKAAGYQFIITRISYSYPGQPNQYDHTAGPNYYGAKAAGLVAGGYHKVGWTDPVAEADFYVQGMQPLVDGDLLAYDIEPASDVAIPASWSAWEQAFVQRIHDKTGTWPLRYLNVSMNNAMPAEGVVQNCASWVAAPSYSWDATVPVHVMITIQQGPTVHVPGITANVCDTDAFFGDRDSLLKLAWHAPQPTPAPAPAPAPVIQPAPAPAPEPPVSPVEPPVTVSTPQPVQVTVSTPNPAPEPPTKPTAPVKKVVVEPTYYSIWELIVAVLKKLLGRV